MIKLWKKIAAASLTAIFAFLGIIFADYGEQKSTPTKANAATSKVDIKLEEATCAEFAQFSMYEDTHRTRIIVAEGVSEWGLLPVTLQQPSWLKYISVNGKTIAEYQNEYIASGAPALETSDLYIKEYGCAPINVFFTHDYAKSANVIDIYIPECYISAENMQEVSIQGAIEYLYDGDSPCLYTLEGKFTIQNPNLPVALYTVTFDANNGSENVCVEVIEGSCIETSNIPANPKKEETESHTYEFVGWSYINENNEKVYWDFTNDKVNGNLTLTAEFQAVEKTKHIVIFDADNGSAKVTVEVYKGSCIKADDIPVNPEKAETDSCVYTFKNWLNTDTGTPFDFSTPITSNLTLIVDYTATAKYTVTIGDETQIVLQGQKLQEPVETPTMEETQSHTFEFVGWSYTNASGEKVYWDFANDKVNGNLTLIAEFQAVEKNKYTVTFDADNGSETVTVEVYRGVYINMSDIPTNPEQTETESHTFEFVGWSYTNASGEKVYWDFANDKVNGNLTLIAEFQALEKTKHIVIFDADNGSAKVTVEVYKGSYIKADDIPVNPEKAETDSCVYTFKNWLNADTGVPFDFSTPITSNFALIAGYTVKAKYTVTIDGVMQRVVAGGFAKEPEIAPTKVETDSYVYTFAGWFIADTGGSFSFDTPIESNLTIVAKFNAIVKYKVSIDGSEQMVAEGSRLTKPSATPTKGSTESHDYEFIAWYYIDDAGEKLYWDFEEDKVRGTLTLVADFRAVEKPKYTVTFDADNGSEPVQRQVYKGSYIKTEQIPNDPVKSQNGNVAYVFYCWSADGVIAWDFTKNTPITENLTLKAYYSTKNVYIVSIDGKAQLYDEGAYVEKPADPVKAATAEYAYKFEGWYYFKEGKLTPWDFERDTVTADVALVAEFSSTKVCYTVSIYLNGADGTLITKILEWGDTIPYPTTYDKEWYEFLGWVDENGNAAANIMPTEDISVYADWKMIEYTATVECSNGVRHEETYTLETAETALQNLKDFLLQANSEQYTYAWGTELPQRLLAQNCSFYALATKVCYKLTVITDPSNAETTTRESTLGWGEAITLQTPQALRGRTFLGWFIEQGEAAPTVMPTKNLTVYGNWKWIEYTLSVIDYEGVESKISYTAKEADDPLYVQALFASFLLPENTKAYTYDWSAPLPEILPLESGKTYVMTKTAVEYTISFANVTGIAPITFTVETLPNVTFPEALGKIGYTVAWDKTPSGLALEDTTVTAIYTPIEYTISFVGAEGVKPITFTVETMESVRLPAVPERRGYTGKWDKKLSEIGLENAIVTAIYEVIEYTVTFAGAENVPSRTFTIETLLKLAFPDVPTKAGYTGAWDKASSEIGLENTTVTAIYTPIEYTLTFAGVKDIAPMKFTVETLPLIKLPTVPKKEGYTATWDKKLSEIGLKDTTITAVYEVIEYQITFINADGVDALTFTVETLPDLAFPNIPKKVGYTGAWDKASSEIGLENTTVTAIYTPIVYMVTFANADGVDAIKFTVETLSTLVFPESPSRIGYTSVWDKQPSELGLENTTVAAVYIPITYTIEFANAEGVEALTFTVEDMDGLRLPAVPEKLGYVGKWDKNLSDLGLANATVTAIYTPIEYTINFVGAEGIASIVFTVENIDGIHLPVVPEKLGYMGKWDKDVTDITLNNITFTAIYTPIEYTVRFIGAEGFAPIVFTVENIKGVQFPAVPEKAGYVGEWDKSLSDVTLENLTVTAEYTPIEYTLVFAGAEGVAPIVFTVESLESIQLPAVPEKEGYIGSWDKSLSEIGLGNVTLTAVYTIIEYTVTFVGVEGLKPIVFTVETLSMLTLPEVPAKEGFTAAWDKTAADIKLENTVVTAVYTPLPVVDQVKDYGNKLATSCFGSVEISNILIPISVAWAVCFKKKED